MPRARGGKSQDKMSRLMSAAEAEFAKVGLEAASLETIAARARVSRQLIYNRFGGKRALYARIQTDVRNALFDTLVRDGEQQPTPLLAVSAIFEALFHSYAGSPLPGRSIADQEILSNAAVNPADWSHQIYDAIESYIAEGRHSGEIASRWSGKSFFDIAAALIAGVVALGNEPAVAKRATVDFIMRALTRRCDDTDEPKGLDLHSLARSDVSNIDRIISAAEAEFTRAGVEASSFSDIARRGGVSKQLIYYHFKNKRALYKAVQDRLLDRVLPHFEIIDLESLSPLSAIRSYVGTYERVQAVYPNSMKLDLYNRLQRGRVEVGDASGRSKSAHFLRRFDAVVRRGKEEGVIHQDVTAEMLFNASAIVFCSGVGATGGRLAQRGDPSRTPARQHSVAHDFIVCGSMA
jgi:AcrR family transcriptional regulator